MCFRVQKKSTPLRKPRNSGGSPSGVSPPPTLATRKMKNTTTWALCRRLSLAQQRADQQHGRARGAHHRGQQRAQGEQPGVEPGRTVQVALHQDAAGDGEQRQQQHDEGQVFGEQHVHAHGQGRVGPKLAMKGARNSNVQPAVILPKWWCQKSPAMIGSSAMLSRMPANGSAQSRPRLAPSTSAAWARPGRSSSGMSRRARSTGIGMTRLGGTKTARRPGGPPRPDESGDAKPKLGPDLAGCRKAGCVAAAALEAPRLAACRPRQPIRARMTKNSTEGPAGSPGRCRRRRSGNRRAPASDRWPPGPGHAAGGAHQAAEDHRRARVVEADEGAAKGVATITRMAFTRPAAMDSAITSELAPMAAPVTGPTM